MNLRRSFRVPTTESSGNTYLQQLSPNTTRQFCVAPLPMLIAPTLLKRRRLCFPVAALENFGPTRLCYSPQPPSSQPTWLSSRQQVEHVVPARDSVSSWLSWHCSVSPRRLLAPETSLRLTQWLGRPIFSQLSTPSPTLPAAICVLSWLVSLGLLADVSRAAGSFSLTSSTS
jgi:hypothetical protein